MLRIDKFCYLNVGSRLVKGFRYEMYLQSMLKEKGIEFNGNPRDYTQWKKYTATGYDIRLKDDTKIEAKFVTKKIFPSWFRRDWLSRNADLIVTNDKFLIPFKLRYKSKVPILTTTEFLIWLNRYISKKVITVTSIYLNSHHNKVCSKVSSVESNSKTKNYTKEVKDGTLEEFCSRAKMKEKSRDSNNANEGKDFSKEKINDSMEIYRQLNDKKKFRECHYCRKYPCWRIELMKEIIETIRKRRKANRFLKKFLLQEAIELKIEGRKLHADLLDEIEKCRRRRLFLHKNLDYDLFSDEIIDPKFVKYEDFSSNYYSRYSNLKERVVEYKERVNKAIQKVRRLDTWLGGLNG